MKSDIPEAPPGAVQDKRAAVAERMAELRRLRAEKLRFRPARPDAARNARPRAVAIRHGGVSALLASRLDKRTPEYLLMQQHAGELVQHLGGESEVTTPMREVVEACARHELAEELALGECYRSGFLVNGLPSTAWEAYMRASSRRVELLRLLGLERRQKPVPSLAEYLASKQDVSE